MGFGISYTSSLPDVLGTAQLGRDLGGLGPIVVRAQYSTQIAGNYLAQFGMLKFESHF
jgi:hypothetical protein